MDSRDVYRGIEDVLGRTSENEHPHSFLTKRLRQNYREMRDCLRLKEVYAVSLASISGNPVFDAEKIGDRVFETLREIQDLILPYAKKPETEDPAESDNGRLDRYFAILKEMDRVSAEQSGKETPPD